MKQLKHVKYFNLFFEKMSSVKDCQVLLVDIGSRKAVRGPELRNE